MIASEIGICNFLDGPARLTPDALRLARLHVLAATLRPLPPTSRKYAPIDRGREQGCLCKTSKLHRACTSSARLTQIPNSPSAQGKNLVHLIDREDEPHCFRLQKDRVFYVSESSMKLAISVARPNLVSLGTCFGKFSKSGKFKLHVTAVDYLAQYAKYKVCYYFRLD